MWYFLNFKKDLCPPGTFSIYDNTSDTCTKCAKGTYNPSTGQTSCLQCPPLQDSYEGATKCFSSFPPCTSSDFYKIEQVCIGNTKNINYQWIQPLLCNTSHPNSVNLPQSYTSQCSIYIFLSLDQNCLPGQYFDGSVCSYCNDTSFSTGSFCQICSKGNSLQLKNQYYTNFSQIPTNWKVGCEGECISNGWRFIGNQMDSGEGNGISSSYFEYPPFVVTP